jgi:hypothetical protein
VAVAGEIRRRRHRQLVPEQRLGRHDHQRLAEIAQHLAPQDVEVIGRRRAVRDLHIVLGAKLQIALGTGGGMLGTLAFISVGEQHHEPRCAQPLGLARGDELVDDHLRAVREVPELRLPENERPRVGDRIAIFETEHAELAERRIANLEAAALDMGQRDIFAGGLLINPDGMALAERAAAAVLARQADGIALLHQGAKGERLGGRPVEAVARLEHLPLGVDDPRQRLVDVKVLGNRREGPAHLVKGLFVDCGADVPPLRFRRSGLAEAGPAALEPVGLVRDIGFGRLELAFQHARELRDDAFHPVGTDDTFLRQARGVDVGDRRMLADLGIHERLSEARLVALIVAEAAIAPHVDDDVALERLPIFDGELAGEGHRFRIVAVDVQDRRLD